MNLWRSGIAGRQLTARQWPRIPAARPWADGPPPRRSGREGLGEILGVDGVDGGEIIHILDENGGFDHFGDVRAGGGQQGGDVLKDLVCLGLQPLGQGAGLRDDGDLAGAEHQIAHNLGLGIRADGGGGFVGRYGFHTKNSFIINNYVPTRWAFRQLWAAFSLLTLLRPALPDSRGFSAH